MTAYAQTPPDLLTQDAADRRRDVPGKPVRAATSAVLACPICDRDLRIEAEQVLCVACEHAWPRGRNGAPCFIGHVSDDGNDVAPSASDQDAGFGSRVRGLLTPPTMGLDLVTTEMAAKLRERLGCSSTSRSILNVGCGPTLTDSVAQLGDGLLQRTVHLDVMPHSDLVDIVADAGKPWPIKTGSLDAIISTAVVCYVDDPLTFARQATRCLAPGGVLLVTAPFMQPQMEDADCARWTLPGLRRLFGDLETIEHDATSGPATVLGKVLQETLAVATTLPFPRLWGPARSLWGWLLWPVKYLDIILRRHPGCATMSSAMVLMAIKPDARD